MQLARLRLRLVTVVTFMLLRQLYVVVRLIVRVITGILVLNCPGGLVQAVDLTAMALTTEFLATKGGTVVRILGCVYK